MLILDTPPPPGPSATWIWITTLYCSTHDACNAPIVV